MRILIAEDDAVSRRMLEATLTKWNYEVVVTTDGQQALEALAKPEAPSLAVLDWMMPGLDGSEVCRRARAHQALDGRLLYILLLTAKGNKEDIVEGLTAGADDYIVKPFDRAELQARINVGERILRLQAELAERVKELELALSKVKQLQGLLPICCYCKKIRDDQNYWRQVEGYVAEHSEAQFTHAICPSCREKIIEPQLEKLRLEQEAVPK
ncbi:MAG TPA: response regulator transcription factor [Verrucomicrobiae bacterium]|nr:response regulator transcription factor [Verrucomicrobiae bacterium]